MVRGWPQPWAVACVYWHICVDACVWSALAASGDVLVYWLEMLRASS
jgi:hypothetical protein